MRIIVDDLLSANLHTPIGPTGTLRRLIANRDYFSARGMDFGVFTYDIVRPSGMEAAGNPPKRRFGRIKALLRGLIQGNRWLTVLYLLRERRRVQHFVRVYLALGRRVDILVFHEEYTAYEYLRQAGFLGCNRTRQPQIVLFQHSDGTKWTMELASFPKLRNTWLYKRMDREMDLVYHRADRLVFIARVGLENFNHKNPDIPRERLVFFHNGIEDLPLAECRERNGVKYDLVCTGTVNARKGQPRILEALGRLREEQRKEFHLTIVGDGPAMEACRELTRCYGMEEQVTFRGRVANREMHGELQRHGIFILMSSNEGLPISIIEAMRAGLPVITTNLAGMPEQVETGRNGVLIACKADALAELLGRMEEYDWEAMGQESRRRFEREFTFSLMLQQYCAMLEGVAKSESV